MLSKSISSKHIDSSLLSADWTVYDSKMILFCSWHMVMHEIYIFIYFQWSINSAYDIYRIAKMYALVASVKIICLCTLLALLLMHWYISNMQLNLGFWTKTLNGTNKFVKFKYNAINQGNKSFLFLISNIDTHMYLLYCIYIAQISQLLLIYVGERVWSPQPWLTIIINLIKCYICSIYI